LVGARTEDLARAGDQTRQAHETFERARLSEARQLTILSGQLAQTRAQLADAIAGATEAHADAVRARRLFATGDISGQQNDAANARDLRTRAQADAARAAVRAISRPRARHMTRLGTRIDLVRVYLPQSMGVRIFVLVNA
jgi:multidrug resistance efflux pump